MSEQNLPIINDMLGRILHEREGRQLNGGRAGGCMCGGSRSGGCSCGGKMRRRRGASMSYGGRKKTTKKRRAVTTKRPTKKRMGSSLLGAGRRRRRTTKKGGRAELFSMNDMNASYEDARGRYGPSGLCGGKRGKSKKKSSPRKTNPWLVHVKKFRAKHPDMPYHEVLKKARSSYTRVSQVKKGSSVKRKRSSSMGLLGAARSGGRPRTKKGGTLTASKMSYLRHKLMKRHPMGASLSGGRKCYRKTRCPKGMKKKCARGGTIDDVIGGNINRILDNLM